MARPVLSLKARAIGLLAQREHSRTELRRKLLRIERDRLAKQQATAAPTTAQQDGPAVASFPEDSDDAAQALSEQVDTLLDTLVAEGYLSEERFVESRLHSRAQRFGLQRIQQELAQHGLSLDIQQQTALRDSELSRAREVRYRRFGDELPTDAREQARQMRFLLARGFSGEIARRALRPPG